LLDPELVNDVVRDGVADAQRNTQPPTRPDEHRSPVQLNVNVVDDRAEGFTPTRTLTFVRPPA